MLPFHFVVLLTSFDEDPGLLQRVADLAIRQFIPEARVEVFVVSGLPRRARGHAGGLRQDRLGSVSHFLRNEPRVVVRPDEPRRAALDKEIGQGIRDIRGVQPPVDTDH
ncbi:transposase IS3/IS911 family protein [Rhodovulum sulfidophilum]|uniref:Transposase IS3/IS911 family protein n=1 Tax=Rhodovulum sulfidophilum TaxID=35806 RepID=A0A0D6B470_RHOSU|nr:transposase IS3/IS911 family protein [Rhodovulum sulfidophilum]